MKTASSKQGSFLPRANDWNMAGIWNASLVDGKDRPVTPRERLWASELGKAPIEIFLKMRGVAATNPPNPRAKRKMEAGNVMEWIINLILKRAGILKETQKWVGFQYPGLLQVSGKVDHIAGGIPDYENWKQQLEAMELPEVFMRASQAIITHFQEKYPEGLGDLYLETKSCSSYMMDSMEKTGRSLQNHRIQLFHYLKAENFPRGNIVYICRDDLRMFEVKVENPDPVIEGEYRGHIETLSKFYYAHKDTPLESFLVMPDSSDVLQARWNPGNIEGLPALEKYIVFDEDLGKFSRNWGVEYSSYLTLLYGFETQLAFEEVVNPRVARWNRVLGRMKTGQLRAQWLKDHGITEEAVRQDKIEGSRKKGPAYAQFIEMEEGKPVQRRIELPKELQTGFEMTPKNLEVIEEIKAEGFKVEELITKFAGEKEEVEE